MHNSTQPGKDNSLLANWHSGAPPILAGWFCLDGSVDDVSGPQGVGLRPNCCKIGAAARFGDNAIVRDCCADQSVEMLDLEIGQVNEQAKVTCPLRIATVVISPYHKQSARESRLRHLAVSEKSAYLTYRQRKLRCDLEHRSLVMTAAG